jgi:hypothetical protein
MHTRKYLLFARLSKFFSDVCNLKISQATLCNLLKVFAQRAQSACDLIGQKVENGKVVGEGGAGTKVNRESASSGLLKAKLPLVLYF